MDRFEDVKDRVKQAHDLVNLIEGYVPLRRRGKSLVGLCPFHDEKTPSFTVYPDSQHFKCYGCSKAGDVYTFVMEREGLSFRECMELLAEKAGISIDGVFGGGREADRGPRVDVHGALAEVRDFFRAQLDTPAGKIARDYLTSRGLDEAIDAFGLGVHPGAQGALVQFARSQRLPKSVLEQAGLLAPSQRQGSSLWEPFAGRVMFPIEDERGRVVGFGGRRLDEGPRKYVNSPEAPFFHKGKVLYGLYQAKRAGVRQIVVMEGYTDVLACHLAGFAGAVATLGTAFTPEHAKVLYRYASDGVVLLFDGDRAGRAAAERAFGELVKSELPVRIALMDEGTDPADLVGQPDGQARFAAILEGAEDALTTWFRLKRRSMDLSLESSVAKVLSECGRVLDGVDDPARREVLLGRMASHLGLDVETAKRSLAGRQKRPLRRAKPEVAAAQPTPEQPPHPAEQSDLEMVACLLADPALSPLVTGETFVSATAEQLIGFLSEAGDGPTSREQVVRSMFTRCAETPELSRSLARCLEMSGHIKEPGEALSGLLAARKSYFSRQAAQRTRIQIKQAHEEGDQALAQELAKAYYEQHRHRSGS